MERFETADARDAAAAALISSALQESLAERGEASLVATGGSTPGGCYDRLSRNSLDWSRVTVTLSDERLSDDPAIQNTTLVKSRLLHGQAGKARFVPLRGEAGIAALLPFDVVLLGMGEDGHIASIFPGQDLPEGLVASIPMSGLAPFVPRVTLTLQALVQSRLTVILIGGAAKAAVLERVRREADYAPPVAALLRQSHRPLHVFWSP